LFIVISEGDDAFVPTWHELKNSVTLEIGLWHWHPFTNSHFYSLILMS